MILMCAYCAGDCANEDPYAWHAGYPFCSEACFEEWMKEE